MSMISELAEKLRRYARFSKVNNPSWSGAMTETADTIEALSEKVRAQSGCLLEELEEYRKIGTPDECRAAREKQVLKKPDRITAVGRGLRENDEGHMIYVNVQMDYYECPKCGSFLVYASDCENDENYQCSHCTDCGQAIDWSGICDEEKNSLHEGHAGQI